MKSLSQIKEAIAAKLRISNHNAEIAKSRKVLADFENRSGKIAFREIVTPESTTHILEEIKKIETSPQPNTMSTTKHARPEDPKARGFWEEAKAGKTPSFLTNNMAQAVIKIAAAEIGALAKAPAASASTPASKPAATTSTASPSAATPAVPTAGEIAAAMLEQQRAEASGEGILAQFESLPAAQRGAFYRENKSALKTAEANRSQRIAAEAREASVSDIRSRKAQNKTNN